jgi:hypothetical protein
MYVRVCVNRSCQGPCLDPRDDRTKDDSPVKVYFACTLANIKFIAAVETALEACQFLFSIDHVASVNILFAWCFSTYWPCVRIYLYLYLSITLSIVLSIYRYHSIYLSIYLSIYIYRNRYDIPMEFLVNNFRYKMYDKCVCVVPASVRCDVWPS